MIVLSVLLPIIFKENNDSINGVLGVIATLISSIASLITLIIAIVLFDKYGIEAPLLQKQTEVVFTFLEEYKKIRFVIRSKAFAMFITLHAPEHKQYNRFYKEKLLFSTEYIEGLSLLLKISESPFMPKSINEKLNKLSFHILAIASDENSLDKFAVVNVLGQTMDAKDAGFFNNESMTLLEFFNIIDDLNTEIQSWISKHTSYPPDLNF